MWQPNYGINAMGPIYATQASLLKRADDMYWWEQSQKWAHDFRTKTEMINPILSERTYRMNQYDISSSLDLYRHGRDRKCHVCGKWSGHDLWCSARPL